MRHLAYAFLAFAFAGLFPATSHAEDWAYTGWYPYVYRCSTNSWIYEPANPPLVWDYATNDWVPNPLGGRSFDLRETFDKFPLQLDLTVDDWPDVSMQFLFNFSGVDTSIASCTWDDATDSDEVYTRYSLDAPAGTCLMLVAFPACGNLALELDFDTATSGHGSVQTFAHI